MRRGADHQDADPLAPARLRLARPLRRAAHGPAGLRRGRLVIAPESVVALAPKVRLREDRITGRTVLLAPERGLELNASAVAVLKALDGTRSVREVAAALAATHAAPAERIEAETIALLSALAERALVRIVP
ncbi:pyrroloquinoline quinone biosynthesis peptide chaperone PqqD [Elioraea sp. Yellowstone]|nr:pyrroloquinoline quinone biosynthesis peptide chaperone PqqD [Elioraea sp. Yellowstone]